MSAAIPQRASAVIVGGGVIGSSVAYHLAKLGWSDVVLLERRQLTCGTTWHAAGLIGQLRASRNMTRLAKYSADLYVRLEEETGIATGMRQNGSITVALTEHRLEDQRGGPGRQHATDGRAAGHSPRRRGLPGRLRRRAPPVRHHVHPRRLRAGRHPLGHLAQL